MKNFVTSNREIGDLGGSEKLQAEFQEVLAVELDRLRRQSGIAELVSRARMIAKIEWPTAWGWQTDEERVLGYNFPYDAPDPSEPEVAAAVKRHVQRASAGIRLLAPQADLRMHVAALRSVHQHLSEAALQTLVSVETLLSASDDSFVSSR